MVTETLKYLGKSKKYKNVYCSRKTDKNKTIVYFGNICINGVYRKKNFFEKERDAALWVDKQLLIHGKEAVNILKKVKQ